MKLREALLCGFALAFAALAAELGVLWLLEPEVPILLRRGGDAPTLAARYAVAYALLAGLAWGVAALLGRLAGGRAGRPGGGRAFACLAVPTAALVPPILGAVAMRPTLERLLAGDAARGAAVGVFAALLLAWLGLARRGSPRATGAVATLLTASALALPPLSTFALQHLPSQLLQLPQLVALAAIVAIALLSAVVVARVSRGILHRDRTGRLALLTAAAALGLVAVLTGTWDRSGLPTAEPAAQEAPPSILMIVCDTLRADFAADPQAAPHLERFAQDGIRYEEAWSAAPWTLPSFASMLTSSPPHVHRAGARPPGSLLKEPLRSDAETLAGVLASRGYASVAVLSNATLMPRYGLAHHFHEYRDLMHPIQYLPIQRWIHRISPAAIQGATPTPYLNASRQTERILDSFDRARATGRPVFLLGQYMDPHLPFGAPEEFYDVAPADAGLEDHYRAEVRHFDRAFGRLLEGLRSRGVYRDLLIVFTSDHGEELHEDRPAPGGPHGHTVHEELLHVPLVLKLPGNVEAGRRVAAPVSLMDLAPTLLGAAGFEPPAGFRGIDLLRSSPDSLRDRTLYAGGVRVGPRQRAARRSSEKVVAREIEEADGEKQDRDWEWSRYDLVSDPGEREPRPLSAPPEWAGRLSEESKEAGSAGVEIDPALRDALEALGYTE